MFQLRMQFHLKSPSDRGLACYNNDAKEVTTLNALPWQWRWDIRFQSNWITQI